MKNLTHYTDKSNILKCRNLSEINFTVTKKFPSNVWGPGHAVKHLRFALQIMFDCLTTSQNIARQARISKKCSQCFRNSLEIKHFLVDEKKKCLTSIILQRGQTVKHFYLACEFREAFANDEILLVKHLKFADQAIFNHLATSQSIAWQVELPWQYFWKLQKYLLHALGK